MYGRNRVGCVGTGVVLWSVLSGLAGCAGSSAEMAAGVDVVNAPPTGQGNDFYVGNRAPLLASPLIKLPIGSIEPRGWVRHQLELEADGFTGHLYEFSRWCKFDGSAWVSKTGQGKLGWEEAPYWLKGFTDLGYILQDERILAEARRWIDGVLTSQRDDGYFGAEVNREKHDLWPNMVMMYVLRSHYEATGDERVIPFMTRYCRWMTTVPLEHFLPGSWQKWRAGDNLDSIYWLYNRTGEKWLLDLARVNHERTADWAGGIPTWHGVNLCQCFREPGQYYQQTRDVRYLKATERNYATFMGMYGQAPGGMFGADENCRPGYVGPRQAAETCSMVEFMHSFEILTRITGDPLWADRCEEVAHNSMPAAMTPDLKGLHYLTAPNMVQLDRENKSPLLQNGGDMLSYTPYRYRCCQHNVSYAWPYYAEHLWMATPGNGLAAVLYAASEVKAKVGDGTEVTITETTDYPFDEIIRFKLSTPTSVSFPLLLRIPRWCEGATIEVNGQSWGSFDPRPLSWVSVRRTWKDGDTVTLTLPMKIGVTVWDKNKGAVSVHRGPLTYSLKIGERWQEYDNGGPWAGYEVFPATPRNYGLIVDTKNPPRSFKVVKREGSSAPQPFTPDKAPIALKAKGKRIPQWKQEANGLVGAIQKSPVRSNEPTEDITLIPMGCARLRIAAFPQIGEGPDAQEWSARSKTANASNASHISDQISALNDGIEPKNSGDQSVPRFTWWPRRGTGEWVEYVFSEPRRVRWCEVYWYDDTGKGACRVPASWKVLYRDGNAWRDVTGASAYGTKKDGFNRVTFDAVTTTHLRIRADLRPNHSGGILEWRVGD